MPEDDSPQPLYAAIAATIGVVTVAAVAFVVALIGVGTYVLDRPWLGWGNMMAGAVKYGLFAAACLYVAMDQGMLLRDLLRRNRARKAAPPPYGHWMDNAADDADLGRQVVLPPPAPMEDPQGPQVPREPDGPADGR